MSAQKNTWRTTAFLRYHSDLGFALPLLQRGDSDSKYYIQSVDQYTGLLGGFSELVDVAAEAEAIGDGPVPQVGGDLIYVFLSSNGNIYAGTIDQIKKYLLEFASLNPDRLSICLQITEVLGPSEELRTTRRSMRATIKATAGESAAQAFFEGSTASASLWAKLVAAAPNREAAGRILNNRSRTSVHFDGDRISLDLAALEPSDYAGTSYDRLVEELEEEFALDGKVISESEIQDRSLPDEQSDIESILASIDRTGRQEERLAKLVRYLLLDEQIGRELLKRYSERRGKLAAYGSNRLRELRWDNAAERDFHMSKFVENVYFSCHSMSRGALLYFMARQLSEFDSMRTVIRRIYQGTRSVYVHDWGRDIEAALEIRRRADISG